MIPYLLRCCATFLLLLPLLPIANASAQEMDTLGTGRVAISFPVVDSAYVVVDRDFSHYHTITPTDSVLTLPSGRRHLTIASKDAYDTTIFVEVVRDSLSHVTPWRDPNIIRHRFPLFSSFLRIAWDATLVVHTDADADIMIDGKFVGTGRASLDLPEGKYVVEVVHPVLGRRRERVFVTQNRLSTADIYIRPDRWRMQSLALLPGGSQFYRGQTIRGGVALVAVAGAVAGAVHSHTEIQPLVTEFDRARLHYRSSTSEREALAWGDQAEALHGEVQGARRKRNVFIGVAASLYALQLADGIRRPRSGFRQSVDTRYLLVPAFGEEGAQIRMKVQF